MLGFRNEQRSQERIVEVIARPEREVRGSGDWRPVEEGKGSCDNHGALKGKLLLVSGERKKSIGCIRPTCVIGYAKIRTISLHYELKPLCNFRPLSPKSLCIRYDVNVMTNTKSLIATNRQTC